VPAILAVSREPFLVFASNAFAILGLRAMYFLLGDARERFHYLSHALGAILVFVGVKMAVSHWWHLPTIASLGMIIAILAVAITGSVQRTRRVKIGDGPPPPAPAGDGSSGSRSATPPDR
jgi:tellurite resistance protein TerC